MRGRGALVAVTIISLALAGCQATSFYSSKKLERGGAELRVLLMPPDVQLSLVTAGGMLEPKAEWTAEAKKHITTALRKQMQKHGANLVLYEEPSGDPGKLGPHTQLIKLHGAVGLSILVHKYGGLRLPNKKDKFDWTLGRQVRIFGDEYGADYALFIYLRDSYTSAGRGAVIFAAALFGVVVPGGQQLGFASLVDLRTGDLVWFNLVARSSGDLRTLKAAGSSMNALLKDFPK